MTSSEPWPHLSVRFQKDSQYSSLLHTPCPKVCFSCGGWLNEGTVLQSLATAPEASATAVKVEGAVEEGEITQEQRDAGTLVWTQYLCFSRRVDGVQASRKIFLRARRWHGCSWQVLGPPPLHSPLFGQFPLAVLKYGRQRDCVSIREVHV